MLILVVLLGLVGLLAVAQGVVSLLGGAAFLRFVSQELARPRPSFSPRATVFLPCKGLDDGLRDTLRAVRNQDFPSYEVICAVESDSDPAAAVIDEIASEPGRVPLRRVVAGLSDGYSQKIANLLAAIAVADPQSQVFVFLDSDSVPHPHWLAWLVAPLADPGVGGATGYRWYVPNGTWAALNRCLWNGATLTFLGDHGRNFCWGGSTAIRRETFESLEIAQRWRTALSEDFEVTRALYRAGLKIRFVPQCVLPSEDDVSWRGFWTFARRQLIITRVCHPPLWTGALVMTFTFNLAFWGALLFAPFAAATGHLLLAQLALALAAAVLLLAAAKALVRYIAVRKLFAEPRYHRWVLPFDSLGAPLLGVLHLGLMLASAVSRRFWWRGVRYEMLAPERVRILARDSAGV